jgi:DNA-binding NarL/FixJ family response regulator
VGYLLKDAKADALAEAVRGAVRGESQMDPAVARKVLTAFRHLDAPTSQSTRPEGVPPDRLKNLPLLEKLTEREAEVLDLLAQGLSNKEIAAQLKNHVSNILGKLHANDRTQAVLTAIRRGLVDLD